jgi:hypothetical protein
VEHKKIQYPSNLQSLNECVNIACDKLLGEINNMDLKEDTGKSEEECIFLHDLENDKDNVG